MRHFLPAALLLAACAASADPLAPGSDDLLLVGNKGEDTVSVLRLEDGAELARIPTSGDAPHEIAVSPDGSLAAVVNYRDNDIDLLDTATMTLTRTLDLGDNTRPHGLVWHRSGVLIATTEGSNTIVRVDPGTGAVQSFPSGADGTHMVAVNDDASVAFTADMGSHTVTRIDLTDGSRTAAPAGTQPEGVTLAGDEVWVSARGSDEVFVFDAATLEERTRIPIGRFPLRILASPDEAYAVTSNLVDGTVTVIDTTTREVVRTIEVSGEQSAAQVTLLFSPDGSRLYAAETGTDTVAEIDFASGRILRRLDAGRQGDGLAIVKRP